MDAIGLDLRSLCSRRAAAAAAAVFAAMVAYAVASGRVGDAAADLEHAQPVWLWAAGAVFAVSLFGSASAWRVAFATCGSRLGAGEAAGRYAIGSLVNGLSPTRVGGAVRLGLFAEALPGQDRLWRAGGASAAVAAARMLVFGAVMGGAGLLGVVPMWPLLVAAAVVVAAAFVALVARRRIPRSHVARLLDAFRELGRSPRAAARIVAWVLLSTTARVAGAAAVAAALGVRSPVLAALLILPALDVAGLIPLSGNVGITSGAVAVALEAHGVEPAHALATGLAFHAVELAAGIACGLAGVVLLAPRRRVITLAAAGAAACIAAAFTATVLLPLA